ncbi:MAG: hypothetical protein NVSMB1_26870 [Polyangiales bacterium]
MKRCIAWLVVAAGVLVAAVFCGMSPIAAMLGFSSGIAATNALLCFRDWI